MPPVELGAVTDNGLFSLQPQKVPGETRRGAMEFFRLYGKTANKSRSAWMPAVAALLFVWHGCVVLAQETPFAQGTNADTEGSFLASPAPLNSSGPLALPENPHPSDSQLLAPSDPPQNVSAGLAAPVAGAPAAPAAPAGTAPAHRTSCGTKGRNDPPPVLHYTEMLEMTPMREVNAG